MFIHAGWLVPLIVIIILLLWSIASRGIIKFQFGIGNPSSGPIYNCTTKTVHGRVMGIAPWPAHLYAYVCERGATVPNDPFDPGIRDNVQWLEWQHASPSNTTGPFQIRYDDNAKTVDWPDCGKVDIYIWGTSLGGTADAWIFQYDGCDDCSSYGGADLRTLADMTPENVRGDIGPIESVTGGPGSGASIDAVGPTNMRRVGYRNGDGECVAWEGVAHTERWRLEVSRRHRETRGVLAIGSKGDQREFRCDDWDYVGPNRLVGTNGNDGFVTITNGPVDRLEPAIGICGGVLGDAGPVRRGPYRFVTLLENAFVSGFLGLLESLKSNAGIDFVFTAVVLGELSPENVDRIASTDIPCDLVPCEDLGRFEFDPALDASPETLRATFQKILIWRLPYDHPVCYVDTDLLCLGSLERLPTLPATSVVVDQWNCVQRPTWNSPYRVEHGRPWNSGFFVFQPDPARYDDIQEFARGYSRKVSLPDQVILVDYFDAKCPNELHYLDVYWNLPWFTTSVLPELLKTDRVKFLHYLGNEKPWHTVPRDPNLYRLWELWQEYRPTARVS